jgi:hypothetical protein
VNKRDRWRDIAQMFLARRRCECGCGRVADTVIGPPRSKRLPSDQSKWRGLAWACAEAEQQEAAQAA